MTPQETRTRVCRSRRKSRFLTPNLTLMLKSPAIHIPTLLILSQPPMIPNQQGKRNKTRMKTTTMIKTTNRLNQATATMSKTPTSMTAHTTTIIRRATNGHRQTIMIPTILQVINLTAATNHTHQATPIILTATTFATHHHDANGTTPTSTQTITTTTARNATILALFPALLTLPTLSSMTRSHA